MWPLQRPFPFLFLPLHVPTDATSILSKRTYVRTILFFFLKCALHSNTLTREIPSAHYLNLLGNSTPDVDCRFVVGDLRWLDENPTGVEGDLPFFGYRGMCQSHPFFSSLGTNPHHHHHQASQIWNQPRRGKKGKRNDRRGRKREKKPCLFSSDFSWLVEFVFSIRIFPFFPYRDSRTMML